MKKLLITVFFLIAGIVVAAAVNYIVDKILIPDPCAYHGSKSETSALFNFFYEISADTGYHPEPTRANCIITLLLGIVVGLLFARVVLRKTK